MAQTFRGHAALRENKELAALKAERDHLQQSLETAERKSLIAERQIRSELPRAATAAWRFDHVAWLGL